MDWQRVENKSAIEPLILIEAETNSFFGIVLKKEATVWNLFAIFHAFFLMAALGSYCNVQIIYLGRALSNMVTASTIAGLCFTTLIGYIYDIFLRKWPMFLAGIIGSTMLFIIPYTAPSLVWLSIVRAVVMMCTQTLMAHPLVMDYVKQKSRGKAAAIQGFGVLSGEAFAISAMLGYSKRAGVSHYEAFAVVALLVALLSSILLCTVRNPKIKSCASEATSRQEYGPPTQIDEENEGDQTHLEGHQNQPQLSKLAKMKVLTSLVFAECRRDAKYVICFLGAGVARLIYLFMSTFLLLWIISFVKDEVIASEEASKTLYQKIILASILATVFLFPILGHLADKVSSGVIIPITFSMRGICGLSFIFINDPQSATSMTLCCLLVLLSFVETVIIEVLFMRGMPAAIRGTMNGEFALFSNLVVLLFFLVGGQLFDRVDRSAPFVFMATMDFLLVIIAMALIVCTGSLE